MIRPFPQKLPLAAVLLLAMTLMPACRNPLTLNAEDESALKKRIVGSHLDYLNSIEDARDVTVTRAPSVVEAYLTVERREELDAISGVSAHEDEPLLLGPDLLGETQGAEIGMTLQRAIALATVNNPAIRVARFAPAIAEAQIVQAEAFFDAVFFASYDYQDLDTPRPPTSVTAFGTQRSRTETLTVGIRKPLLTGGQAILQTSNVRQFDNPTLFAVEAYEQANVTLSVTQPLLRNFGVGLNMSQIELTRNARRIGLEQARQQILDTLLEVEQAYWNLVLARYQLRVRTRLLERTRVDRDKLAKRIDFDVSEAALTEANSSVESRAAEVIRSRAQVRLASDALKQLIYWDQVPLSSETLIVPLDAPVELAVEFNLLDAVSSALENRPELRQALLQIDDAAVRLRVADNQKLPLLDLTASVRYNGLGDNFWEAYGAIDGNFIDYIFGLQFEAPLGNRQAQGLFRQRQLERRQALANYQSIAQSVIVEVKNAMRNLIASYELIAATRSARRAAADSLRSLEHQERLIQALTPEFIDLKLRRQESLAAAEIQEVQALADYNVSIAGYYRAVGTLMTHNGIEFRADGFDDLP